MSLPTSRIRVNRKNRLQKLAQWLLSPAIHFLVFLLLSQISSNVTPVWQEPILLPEECPINVTNYTQPKQLTQKTSKSSHKRASKKNPISINQHSKQGQPFEQSGVIAKNKILPVPAIQTPGETQVAVNEPVNSPTEKAQFVPPVEVHNQSGLEKQVAYLDKTISLPIKDAPVGFNKLSPQLATKIKQIPAVNYSPNREFSEPGQFVEEKPATIAAPSAAGQYIAASPTFSLPSRSVLIQEPKPELSQAEPQAGNQSAVNPVDPGQNLSPQSEFDIPRQSGQPSIVSETATTPPVLLAARKVTTKRQMIPAVNSADDQIPKSKGTWTSYINDVLLQTGGINAIALDKSGEKWLATEQGLVQYKQGRWRLYSTANGLGGAHVYAIAIDKAGNKWLGTDKGVSCFDGRSWRNFTPTDGLAGNPVYGIALDKAGHLWFTTENGVSKFDGKNWLTYNEHNGLSNNQVYTLVIDRLDRKWFATSGGLCCFDGKIWQNFSSETSGLLSNLIYSLAVDESNQLWIGTNKGANCFDGKTWRSFDHKSGLTGDTVYAIRIDKRGDKWFGTDNGVSRYNDLSWKQYGVSAGLTSRTVFAIAGDDNGTQWFGTDHGISELALQYELAEQ